MKELSQTRYCPRLLQMTVPFRFSGTIQRFACGTAGRQPDHIAWFGRLTTRGRVGQAHRSPAPSAPLSCHGALKVPGSEIPLRLGVAGSESKDLAKLRDRRIQPAESPSACPRLRCASARSGRMASAFRYSASQLRRTRFPAATARGCTAPPHHAGFRATARRA